MGLSIKGYLLEPPRVGASNSAYTFTPNGLVTDAVAFDSYYTPDAEPVGRTEYCAVVQEEGLLVNAAFGWTKNDGTTSALVRRFDYDAYQGHFRPLPGSAPDFLGTLTAEANTTRLQATAPIGVLVAAPFRISVGSGSGTTFTITLVATDGAFGAPGPQTVELSVGTGHLNWNAADLTTYVGQPVRFQRQSFYDFTESTGRLGTADEPLLLNPLPGPGQYPMLRFGYGFHLTPVQVATEGGFSVDPLSGTVEWSANTGRLKFSTSDVAANVGRAVYYDGVLFSWKQILPTQGGGTVIAPAPITVPLAGGDIIFALSTGYQFPVVRRVTAFDAGTAGEVQIRTSDGAVQFSAVDQATYGASGVTVVTCDFALERGVSLRFFRSPVNLDGLNPSVKDVSAIYTTLAAVWASPIIQVPYVLLPATPIEDTGYPLTVYVEQGTGSFTGVLPDLSSTVTPGFGYVLDYETRQLSYAQRKNDQILTFSEPGGALQLLDFPVRSENLALELESGAGTGNFVPLTLGQTALFDDTTGIVTLTAQTGGLLAQGTGSLVGTTFSDGAADFVAAGVLPGHQLFVPSGATAGVYTVVGVTTTTLTTDLPPSLAGGSAPYEVRTAGEILADRYFQELVPVDPNTWVQRVRALGPAANQQVVLTGGAPGVFITTTQVQDVTADFVTAGVLPGDTVVLTSGPDAGSYRTITLVEVTTLTVDRAFTAFPSANYRVERRLRVPVGSIARTAVRLGPSAFAVLQAVAGNAAFTAPGLLPPGIVQVSTRTGDLNFSAVDVLAGLTCFWALDLRFQTDFRVSKDLGFVELTERLLANDELYCFYQPVTSTGIQPLVTEHVGFLVRKEVTQPWPRPATTSQVVYNAAGRTVAASPAPTVFRGGRPQDPSQVLVSRSPSTVTFLANDGFMTDALPSGSAVEPDERVYVDYYVYEAVGGERSFNVLQPPMFAAQIRLELGANRFLLVGDQTATFPAGYLLRVEQQQVYLLDSAVWDPVEDVTTVTLAYGATFQDDFVNPRLYLSSGPIPLAPVFAQPSYFTTEIASYGSVPRGMDRFALPGDRAGQYPRGTVVLFSGAPDQDLYLVSGALYRDGRTEVVLQQNVRRQYAGEVLKRSVRPILEDGVTQTQTRGVPLLSQGVTLYRRVTGQPGVLLTSPSDYKLDESGLLRYTVPLRPGEFLGLAYTSYRIVLAGTRVRASYTALLTPSAQNGLLGQKLKANYSIFQGDSFFYRVETLTNFSGEVLQDLQAAAQSSTPSAGPTTSNASAPTLFEQGRGSLFFTEGHTTNVDYVARRYLKFFNDNTHRLEDVLQNFDGRVVGDVNGRFRFDGVTDNPVRTAYVDVTNEMDDQFKVSDLPVVITSMFPLAFASVGTFVRLYQPSAFSRFYPTAKAHLTALTLNGAPTAVTGEVIGDFGVSAMTSVPATLYRRLPRALVFDDARAGTTTLLVDNANGDAAFLRPPFVAGMAVVIRRRDGTDVVSDAAPLTVTAVLSSPERVQVAALPVDVPAGSTVFLCVTGATPDTTYAKTYRQGFDVGVNPSAGQLTFIRPYPPFDGSVPLVPAPLTIQAPAAGEALEMDAVGIQSSATRAFKFPALYGGVGSDCGDQSIPVLSPTLNQEIEAGLQESLALGPVLSVVTNPATLSGITLDGTGTVLTAPGPWPSPVPLDFDLVRFTSGANAGTGFRRIAAGGVVGNTITVDTPFPTVGVGGDVLLTATTPLAVSVATFPAPTVLDDPALSLAVQIGHTIILTSGANAGLRRQVVGYISPTQRELDKPVPFAVATGYRASNHLNTYSNWGRVFSEAGKQESLLLNNDHNMVSGVVDSVVLAVNRFFEGDVVSGTDGVLSDLLTPASNAGSVSGNVLTGPGQDFLAAGVVATQLVYIQTGANAGFYAVQTVNSATQVTVTPAFPAAGPVTYRVVRAFGVGTQALLDLFAIRAGAQTWADTTSGWLLTLAVSVPVLVPPGVVDPDVYTNAMTVVGINDRLAGLSARAVVITDPTSGPVVQVEAIVETRDKLYDKRYAWVDARANLQTGSLFVIERAVSDREAATEQLYNDLLRMLSVETV